MALHCSRVKLTLKPSFDVFLKGQIPFTSLNVSETDESSALQAASQDSYF